MRNLIAIVALVFSQVPVNAQPIVASSVTNVELIESCRRTAGNTLSLSCAGYILGVFDQMSVARLICPPINPDGGSVQAVAVALKFLNDHPEKWHLAPVFVVGQSFKAAFPCSKAQQ